ncbi:MAG: agmatinase family protein, partial [Candidatus Eisenbacteria bacterium]|nr:agmatinase family protein [Candidatus Eisenbacteria bacterium]
MSRAEKVRDFDPNSPGDPNSSLFGLPFDTSEAEVIVVPVPWDVTVSYKDGASRGPDAILQASVQVDLFDPSVPDAWKIGLAMDEISDDVREAATRLREDAKRYIDAITTGIDPLSVAATDNIRTAVNEGSLWLNAWVEARCRHWLEQGRLVALLGGDHSTPYGMLKALASRHDAFAILQIDAHADLRDAYEGFDFSHASIMRNALRIPQVSHLVQVGIRDYCQEEADVITANPTRITTFFDRDLKHAQYAGATWAQQVQNIIERLPKKVYVSFDIDGLDPKLCPNTGTPVAGGLEFEQAVYLIEQVVRSGRTIIGCDLNEVSPGESGEWDANVGARMLYRMCNLMAVANG